MKRSPRFRGAAAALVLLTSCGSDDNDETASTTSTAPETRTPVVVDTDLALDDILALLYVASNPDLDLLAVTVTGTGEVICPVGAQNTRRLLAAVGVTDVPVACGQREPLSGDRVFPLPWRSMASRAYDLTLPEVTAPADEPDAVKLLTDTIAGSDRKITLLTLGPLTNVAQALQAKPSLTDHLERIVMMGGAIEVDGNVTPEGSTALLPSEWNFYIDPAADAVVFASGAALTLVSLDATNQVPVTAEVEYLLAGNAGTAAVDLALLALDDYVPPYLWDPLAAIAVGDPAAVPTSQATVRIETDGDDAGRTVADPAGTTVLVAGAPQPDVVLRAWVARLAGVATTNLRPPEEPTTVGEVAFSFDGTTCTATAPVELPVGMVKVTVDNQQGLDYVGIVAHIAPGYTLEEAFTYAMEHAGEQLPMVEEATAVAATPTDGMLTSPAFIELRPGLYGLVCGTSDDAFYKGASVTITE